MNQKLIVFRFVSERKRQVVIEQTRFLSTALCVANLSKRIFTLEQIFVGKIFPVSFICENLFLRIAGKIAKIIRTRKNFAPHGIHCRPSKLINQDFLLPFKKSITTQSLRHSIPQSQFDLKSGKFHNGTYSPYWLHSVIARDLKRGCLRKRY